MEFHIVSLSLFLYKEPKKQRKKLVTWSVEEVCSWLVSLDLELYCESFRQNAIDGMELSNMTGEILATDLGIGEEHAWRSVEIIFFHMSNIHKQTPIIKKPSPMVPLVKKITIR